MKWACLALSTSAQSPRLTRPETPFPPPPFYFSEASARADTPLPPRCRGPLPIQPRPVFRFQPPSLRLSPPLLASVYSLPLQPLRELPRRCLATPTLPRALSRLRVAQPATRAVPGAAAAEPFPVAAPFFPSSSRHVGHLIIIIIFASLSVPPSPPPSFPRLIFFFFPLFSGLAHEPPRELPEKDQQRWL